MPGVEVTVSALHPGEVLRGLRDSFQRRVVVVKGLLKRSEKAYRSGFYHMLLGTAGDALTLVVSPSLDGTLPQDSGRMVTVRGYLDFNLSDSRIQPMLVLTEVLHQETVPMRDPRVALLEKIVHKEKQDVSSLLRRNLLAGKKPRLLFVFAREGIVDHDVERALGDARAAYEIEERRVSFTPEALVGLLEHDSTGNYDVVAFIRGGGSGLEVFDHPRLIEKALSFRVPLIAALGHTRDHTLFARLADWRVETPSLLGTALRDIAEGRTVSSLPTDYGQLRKQLAFWKAAAAVLVLLLIWRWAGG